MRLAQEYIRHSSRDIFVQCARMVDQFVSEKVPARLECDSEPGKQLQLHPSVQVSECALCVYLRENQIDRRAVAQRLLNVLDAAESLVVAAKFVAERTGLAQEAVVVALVAEQFQVCSPSE